MYTLSYSIEVNPDGILPVLTADQVWKGLELKASNALPFVPIMTRCEVVEREGNTLLREISLPEGDFKEFITLHAPVQVQFERVGTKGFIQNTISESQKGLLLTFTFSISFPGAEPGSHEEQQKGEAMRNSYVGALSSTLNKVRELASRNEL